MDRRPGGGFPSALPDAEWAVLGPKIPDATPGGRPRKTDMRSAINAILYATALLAFATLAAIQIGIRLIARKPIVESGCYDGRRQRALREPSLKTVLRQRLKDKPASASPTSHPTARTTIERAFAIAAAAA